MRVLAAANTDLEAAVRAGRFRADLFYRIQVLTLELPPLRERRADIPLLARHFLAQYAGQASGPAPDLSPAAEQLLCGYPWPGNVRELENVIQRAVVLGEHATIRREDIFLPATPDAPEPSTFKALKARAVTEFEKAYLQRLLAEHHGNLTHAAKAAGKDRRALWQLLHKHALHPHPPAPPPARPAPGHSGVIQSG